MERWRAILFFVYGCVIIAHAQILYDCNFDTAVTGTSCLVRDGRFGLNIDQKVGDAGNQPPTGPLSDVTSSLKPTDNGQSCNLPYKVNTYTWDMYFCNNGYCETKSNPNSRCTPGQFGNFNFLSTTGEATFSLNTDSGGTNGTGQQCLIYYYYLPKINGTQQNIIVRKQEPGGSNDTIDTVTNSSFNGWIKRQVSFSTVKPGYKISFTFEKTAGSSSPATAIAIDEISVRLGSCPGEPVTQITATVPLTPTTESETVPTSVVEISTLQTTTTATPEPSTIMSTMKLTTTKPTVTSNNTSMELFTFTSETTSSGTSTTSSTLINPTTDPNNSYIIVLAIVLPAVLIATIGIAICIKKCSSKKKISPSAFQLNQRPPPPSQT